MQETPLTPGFNIYFFAFTFMLFMSSHIQFYDVIPKFLVYCKLYIIKLNWSKGKCGKCDRVHTQEIDRVRKMPWNTKNRGLVGSKIMIH